jgi:hypothetical protein
MNAKIFIIYLLVVTLSSILLSRYEHIRSFLSISFQTNLLTSDSYGLCILFMVYVPFLNKLTSAQISSSCGPLSSNPSCLTGAHVYKHGQTRL